MKQTLPRSGGVVLVTVIWFLAALALAAGAFAAWTYRSTAQAVEVLTADAGTVDIISTRSTVMYLVLTRGLSASGLKLPGDWAEEAPQKSLAQLLLEMETATANTAEEDAGRVLRLDGQAYGGVGNARFSLQDEAGFVAVNNVGNVNHLRKLLEVLGVDQEDRGAYIARLTDYVDRDDLHAINGAERSQYAAMGLSGPANAPLMTPEEIDAVLGWDSLSAKSPVPLPELVTNVLTNGFNANAAPAPVLQIALNLEHEDAVRVVRERAKRPFASFQDLATRTGVTSGFVLDGATTPIPSSVLRLALWQPLARRVTEYQIEFAPTFAEQRPWIVNWVRTRPRREEHAENATVVTESPVFTDAH